MSDSGPIPDDLVQKYPSEILAANYNWTQRLNQTFPQYFPPLDGKQKPKILWIGCSDSRVQESDATVSLPGALFVHRNIANQVHTRDDNAQAVIAYALGALEVQHIVVVGHDHCGGVIHALESLEGPLPDETKHHLTLYRELHHLRGLLDGLLDKKSHEPNNVINRWLAPLVGRLQKLKDEGVLPTDPDKVVKFAVEENVRLQVEQLTQAPLKAFVEQATKKKVWVHGWVYDFSVGFIRDLGVTREIN